MVGQDHVTVTLKNELTDGRAAHAYLFTGSRGTGKTTCAKILAKAINCLHPVEGDPCNECEICLGIESGAILDVLEIDAASNNGVDNIRDLREQAAFTPAVAKFRVYIIDEVHMLSTGAFNALLKTLEEPPAHVLFILATTEIHKLPATIRSRCQRFDFHRIPTGAMTSRLRFVAEAEGFALTDDAALLIARLSDGALRDALSLLDQCASGGSAIDEARVAAVAGLAGRDHLFALADALFSRDMKAVLSAVDTLHKASKDMTRLAEELTAHLRDLMLIKVMDHPDELILCSSEEFARLREQADARALPEILAAMRALEGSLDRMGTAVNRRTELEATLLCLCEPAMGSAPTGLPERVAALEQAVAVLRSSPAARQTAPPAKPPAEAPLTAGPNAPPPTRPAEPEPSAELSAPETGADVPLDCWPGILARLAGSAKPLHGALAGSRAYIAGSRVLIDAPGPLVPALIAEPAAKEALRAAIFEETGKRYALGPYRPPETAAASSNERVADVHNRMRALGIPVHEE